MPEALWGGSLKLGHPSREPNSRLANIGYFRVICYDKDNAMLTIISYWDSIFLISVFFISSIYIDIITCICEIKFSYCKGTVLQLNFAW